MTHFTTKQRPLPSSIRLSCSWCGSADLDHRTYTCPDCGTTMPGEYHDRPTRPKITSAGPSNTQVILGSEARYHGGGDPDS